MNLPRQHTLASLSPFVDQMGLLRVGGRIRHIIASYNFKFPVILPTNHHVVNLIIRYMHRINGHLGRQTALSAIRQRYHKRWKQTKYLADVFWSRWIKEYIHLIQKENKWIVEKENNQVGDLVLLINDFKPINV